jgi:hypothetical protein
VVTLVFSIQELWAELKNVCPNTPRRSQFYEWLKHTGCIDSQPRGGIKQAALFSEKHLNRLICFAQMKQSRGTLKAAQVGLLEEIKRNPSHYFEEQTHV